MRKAPDNYDLNSIPPKRREMLIKKWEVEKAANKKKAIKQKEKKKNE